MKTEYQKSINLLDTTLDNVRRLILKNGWRFIINLEKHRILTKKKQDLKYQYYNQIYLITGMHMLLLKKLLLL